MSSPFIPPLPQDIPSTPLPPSPRPDNRRAQSSSGHSRISAPPWIGAPVVPGSYYVTPVGLPPQGGVSDDFLPPSSWSTHAGLPQVGYGHGGIPPGTPWAGMAQMGVPLYHPATPAYAVAPPLAYPPTPTGAYQPSPWHVPQAFTPGPPPGATLVYQADPYAVQGDPHHGSSHHLGRPNHEDGGINSRFLPGKSYGPVLEPIHVATVHANPIINPLLTPPPNDPKERDYLKWNMLYTSSFAQRSSDPSHISWSKGREEPATFPRITKLRLVGDNFPWMVEIKARTSRGGGGGTGVTCGDVIDQLSEFWQSHVGKGEFDNEKVEVKRKVGEAYHHNRSRAYGVPGGRMGEGLLRADWLGFNTMFDGIEKDNELVRKRLAIKGKDLPCTWVLRTAKRWVSEEEHLENEERERELAQSSGEGRRRTESVREGRRRARVSDGSSSD